MCVCFDIFYIYLFIKRQSRQKGLQTIREHCEKCNQNFFKVVETAKQAIKTVGKIVNNVREVSRTFKQVVNAIIKVARIVN